MFRKYYVLTRYYEYEGYGVPEAIWDHRPSEFELKSFFDEKIRPRDDLDYGGRNVAKMLEDYEKEAAIWIKNILEDKSSDWELHQTDLR